MVRVSRLQLSGTALVAIAMLVMSIANYGFTLVAARVLVPADFGGFTALMSIILVANVASLGIQAVIARQLATAESAQQAGVDMVSRFTVISAASIGILIASAAIVIWPWLQLDSVWPVFYCAVALVPLTIMGAQAGIAQGTLRWRRLAGIYLGVGVGRFVVGSIAIAIEPSVEFAMLGVAIGSWVPVIAGLRLMQFGKVEFLELRQVAIAVAGSSAALLAYFTLSSADSLIARLVFDPHDSGLYAAGLIVTKSALFLPQFVSVVLFPRLAQDRGNQSRLIGFAAVALLGSAVVAGTALLPDVALILVGGAPYAEIAGHLWLFALSGSLLAVLHMLVFDAIARKSRGVTWGLWAGLALLIGFAVLQPIVITDLVIAVSVICTALIIYLWFLPNMWKNRQTEALIPAVTPPT